MIQCCEKYCARCEVFFLIYAHVRVFWGFFFGHVTNTPGSGSLNLLLFNLYSLMNILSSNCMFNSFKIQVTVLGIKIQG